MFNYISENKVKVYGSMFLFISVFALGAYARPGIDIAAEIVSSVIAPTPVAYAAPVSEYDDKVSTLWHSDKHQVTCKANAAAVVSLELANKYLKETQKQQLISNYELPESLVNSVNATETARKKK